MADRFYPAYFLSWEAPPKYRGWIAEASIAHSSGDWETLLRVEHVPEIIGPRSRWREMIEAIVRHRLGKEPEPDLVDRLAERFQHQLRIEATELDQAIGEGVQEALFG